jgi:predicted peptidase
MPEPKPRLVKQTAPGKTPGSAGLGYLLYLPPDYEADPAKKWPLVFFLHGAGERGNDPETVKVHGLPKEIDQGKDFPFIVVAPQCPLNDDWLNHLGDLDALFDQITQNYRVDMDRVYLTGLSMGGKGTWFWTTSHPDKFVAAIPICGRSFPEKAELIKDLPLWVFHGALDPIVPLAESTKMVEALRAVGSDVKLTVYPDLAHDSWTITYANPELYDWLLSHHR